MSGDSSVSPSTSPAPSDTSSRLPSPPPPPVEQCEIASAPVQVRARAPRSGTHFHSTSPSPPPPPFPDYTLSTSAPTEEARLPKSTKTSARSRSNRSSVRAALTPIDPAACSPGANTRSTSLAIPQPQNGDQEVEKEPVEVPTTDTWDQDGSPAIKDLTEPTPEETDCSAEVLASSHLTVSRSEPSLPPQSTLQSNASVSSPSLRQVLESSSPPPDEASTPSEQPFDTPVISLATPSKIVESKLPSHTHHSRHPAPTGPKRRRDSHADKTEIPTEMAHRHSRDSHTDKSEASDSSVSSKPKEPSGVIKRHQSLYKNVLENLEDSIIEGEHSFLKILSQLRDVYLLPLLSLVNVDPSSTNSPTTSAPPSQLGNMFSDALADLKQLTEAQSQLVSHLHDRRLLAQPLAANYALFPNLFSAYKKYISGQMNFIMKLSTLMQNNSKVNALLDPKTEYPQAKELTIWDMLGISVRRLPQLIDVLTAQFDLLVASDIGRCASIDYRKLYKKRYILPSPGQVFPDSCRQAKQALDNLAGLVVDAQRADEFYSAMLFVQSISTRNKHEVIPNNPARRMFKEGEIRLIQTRDFGMSFTIPVVLLLFSDCLAICTKQSSEHSRCFQLHSLYPTPSLIVCDTEANTRALTFTIDIIKTLPPGWIETVVVNPHHRVWSLDKSKITQLEPPSDYISAVMGPVTFATDTTEEKQDWLFSFATATSFSYIRLVPPAPPDKTIKQKKIKPPNTKKKSKKAPHHTSNFGVNLDFLLSRDRILSPGCNVPIIISNLVHHMLLYGLAEEGILRHAGDKELVEEIKMNIDNSKVTSFSFLGMYIHNVATIFKQFLRELPEPLIPYNLCEQFFSITALPKTTHASALTILLRDQLSPVAHHLCLLRLVLHCLYVISLNSHLNQMTPENIAIVMAPNVFRLPPGADPVAQIPFTPKANIVMASMVANYPTLFESPDSPFQDEDIEFVKFKRKLASFPKTTLHNIAHISSVNQIPFQMWIFDLDGNNIVADTTQGAFISRTALSGMKTLSGACASGANVWLTASNGLSVVSISTHSVVFQAEHPCFGVVANGTEVWVGGQGCIYVYDGISFEMIKSIGLGEGNVMNLIKVGSSMWCSTHQINSPTQDIHILDCLTYCHESRFAAHSKKINCLCNVEGTTVWSCCDEGVISVWDISSQRRKEKLELDEGPIYCLAALRKQVWASTRSNMTTIFEARSSKKIGRIKGFHREPVLSIIPLPTKFKSNVSSSTNTGDGRPTAWDIWTLSVDSVCVWHARYMDCRFADKPKDKLKAFKSL